MSSNQDQVSVCVKKSSHNPKEQLRLNSSQSHIYHGMHIIPNCRFLWAGLSTPFFPQQNFENMETYGYVQQASCEYSWKLQFDKKKLITIFKMIRNSLDPYDIRDWIRELSVKHRNIDHILQKLVVDDNEMITDAQDDDRINEILMNISQGNILLQQSDTFEYYPILKQDQHSLEHTHFLEINSSNLSPLKKQTSQLQTKQIIKETFQIDSQEIQRFKDHKKYETKKKQPKQQSRGIAFVEDLIWNPEKGYGETELEKQRRKEEPKFKYVYNGFIIVKRNSILQKLKESLKKQFIPYKLTKPFQNQVKNSLVWFISYDSNIPMKKIIGQIDKSKRLFYVQFTNTLRVPSIKLSEARYNKFFNEFQQLYPGLSIKIEKGQYQNFAMTLNECYYLTFSKNTSAVWGFCFLDAIGAQPFCISQKEIQDISLDSQAKIFRTQHGSVEAHN